MAPNTVIDVTYGAVSPPSDMCPELKTCPELEALTCTELAMRKILNIRKITVCYSSFKFLVLFTFPFVSEPILKFAGCFLVDSSVSQIQIISIYLSHR